MSRYGISRDRVIAIGDSQTDVPMFRMAGTSVALGNASGDVREAATIRTDAPGGDGVIEALQVLAPRDGGAGDMPLREAAGGGRPDNPGRAGQTGLS